MSYKHINITDKVYITKPPYPNYVKIVYGDTLVLTCEAVGVPVPLINWRLNWGHIPKDCKTTSINGIGVLTCPNMRVSIININLHIIG